MRGDDAAGDREAVYETVRAYLSGPSSTDALGGELGEWAAISDAGAWHDRYDIRFSFDGAEVTELGPERAVVTARGRVEGSLKRGSLSFERIIDGPFVLEKGDERWHIVDFVLDGRRRSEAIVLGPLAEQHQRGVTARVVGLDRAASGTTVAVELRDTDAGAVRLKGAYALVEDQAVWSQMSFAEHEPVPDGGERLVLLHSRKAIDLKETVFAVALDVRTASGRRPFVMRVPLERPAELEGQRPPAMLPLLRGSASRRYLPWALFAAALAWWAGWFAVMAPVYLVVYRYWQLRVVGRLPHRLDPVRYAVDVVVVGAAFLVLWESPTIDFAVPSLVTALVFLALRSLKGGASELPAAAAIGAGSAWLFLLGINTAPLSPCRLVGGSPGARADAFARAMYAGDPVAASRNDDDGFDDQVLSTAVYLGHQHLDPVTATASRRALPAASTFCRVERKSDGAVACYLYTPPGSTGISVRLYVSVGCNPPDWRVFAWY